MQHRLIALLVTATIAAAGCKRDAEPTPSPAVDQATQAAGEAALTDWPKVESAIKADPAIEARIKEILAGMSLRQKVGQMTQSEIKTTKPEDVRNYYLGSVLNGGGSWPAMNKHAAVADWAALADGYYDASMATDLKVKIPIIWGTDAVHGHSNVYGRGPRPGPGGENRRGHRQGSARNRRRLAVRTGGAGGAGPALGPYL